MPEPFSPAHMQSQYKVSKWETVSLTTSVLVNQTVGGNVPGQWIAVTHTSEASRLVWAKHMPESTLPSTLPESKCSRVIPKSQVSGSSPLLEVKGVARYRRCPFRASWNKVPRNILGLVQFICSPWGKRSLPQILFQANSQRQTSWMRMIQSYSRIIT